MKKLMITLVMAGISMCLQAQITLNVYSMRVGDWDHYSKSWDFEGIRPAKLKITLHDKIVTINDKAHSRFTVIKDLGPNNTKDYRSHDWRCYDEIGRRCDISLTYYSDNETSLFMTTYGNICFQYFFNVDGEDPVDNF